MKRSRWLTLMHTALHVEQPRFARLLAWQWLAAYPGDLEVQRLHAQALLAEGHLKGALEAAATVARRDPEDATAVQTWALAAERLASPDASLAWAALAALQGDTDPLHPAPDWSRAVYAARLACRQGNLDQAEAHLHRALAADPDFPLVALTHLQVLLAHQPDPHAPEHALRHLSAFYHERFPDTLAFTLLHAAAQMDAGQEESAVALLHQVAAADLTGRVARRLWGDRHPYCDLWPVAEQLSLPFAEAVPAPVAAALGWNRLPDGRSQPTETAAKASAPPRPTAGPRPRPPERSPQWRQLHTELKRLAADLHRPSLAQVDARFPVYIALSTRAGLEHTFGPQAAAEILQAMQALTDAVGGRPDWDALCLLADDPASTRPHGLEPVPPRDPWAIKLLLADLDARLASRGLMIGALLIVGGDEVVPLHRLPNPVDDRDHDVPSDAPYATRDENYFVAEWPTGRLPGREAGLMLSRLRDYAKHHRARQARPPWHRRLWYALLQRLRFHQHRHPGFGYSAEIWQRTAVQVLRPIGDPKDLWCSPPIALNGKPLSLPTFPLAYFNLHGEPDRAEWYGQADPFKSLTGPDYPVALRPTDLIPHAVPQVVFTEACYGAHVFGKEEHQSLALRFLGCGTQAFVGSTVTAYGSQMPPLFAADLLGLAFWKYLTAGEPVGVALQKARLYLIQDAYRKAGKLNGDDQKTLISFVLYGDPLFQTVQRVSQAKTVAHPRRQPPPLKTVCDRADGRPAVLPPETLERVKGIVARYLPGMENARMSVATEHTACHAEGHLCPTAQLGSKTRPPATAGHRVITLARTVRRREGEYHQYARLTLDAQGRVVRIAVSR